MGLLRQPPEEKFINSYAAYMGYLLMGVKGLGFLLLTWSTVVLLGGFVSMLEKKDFWSVTVITLMQTAGVFDVFMKKKLSNIGYSYFALLTSEIYIREPPQGSSRARELVTTIVWIVMMVYQVLILTIILFPLAVLYYLGLYICTAIALWRLVKRDYYGGAAEGGDAANLKPALDVLYSLAVGQGALFFYRTAYAFAGNGAVEKVIDKYKMTSSQSKEAVRGYLSEMRSGCDKDPSFCIGKDLITYAVSLMESQPPDDESDSFFCGLILLDEIIVNERRGRRSKEIERLLLRSRQPSNILHKLLCSLDSNIGAALSARIVEHVADCIHLELYPSGIHRILSLLPTSPQDCVFPDSEDTKLRMELGMRILLKLAAATDNCRIMSETKGFLSRIVVPLTPVPNVRLHLVSQTMADASLKLIDRLIALPGDAGINMRREISSNNDLMYALESIIDVSSNRVVHCNTELRTVAKDIANDFSKDILSSKIASESRGISIMALLGIFFDDNIDDSIKQSAGEKLAKLSQESASTAEKILKGNDDVVGNLVKILLAENNICRANAAEILAGIYTHCAGEECVEKLKAPIVDLILEVLRRIHNISALSIGQKSNQEEMNLQRALLALCATVCDSTQLFSVDQDLAHKLHVIATKFCSEQGIPKKPLAVLIKEARERLDKAKRHDAANVPATSSSTTP